VNELLFRSATEAARLVSGKEVTARELTEHQAPLAGARTIVRNAGLRDKRSIFVPRVAARLGARPERTVRSEEPHP
jgi:hypothetical protein